MDMVNNTGFPHFLFEKVGRYGELFTVIVVSQTFKFPSDQGLCQIAEKQSAPVMADTWYGKPERSSLKTVTDLVCKKTRTDILFNGHAWNATGRKSQWQAEILAGNLYHCFYVCGPREWHYTENYWRLSKPGLTERVPLRHELAPFSEFNPVGIRPPSDANQKSPCPAPQLSASPGAFCRSWPTRLRYAKGFTKEWQKKISPFYPEEFDFAFMNAAPPEQQYDGYLSGNEKIILRGLLPSRAEQVCHLPGIRMLAQLNFHAVGDSEPELHSLLADTLTIHTDEELLNLTWRLTLPFNPLLRCIVLMTEQESSHG